MQFFQRTICVSAVVGVLVATGPGWALSPDGPGGWSGSPEPAAARMAAGRHQEPYAPGRLLVRFKPEITRASRQTIHYDAQAKGVLKEYHVVEGLQLVEVRNDKLSATRAVYQNHPDVLYAEPDYTICVTEIPNDYDFGLLWGLRNIGQEVNGDPGTPGADIRAVGAWDIFTGDPDLRIAVIDSGVDYNHPELAGNIWTNPGEIPDNGIDDEGNGYIDDVHGYDFHYEDSDPFDGRGHGTHVAGTIGAVGNNGAGVVGVTWQCKIVALKFLSDGG